VVRVEHRVHGHERPAERRADHVDPIRAGERALQRRVHDRAEIGERQVLEPVSVVAADRARQPLAAEIRAPDLQARGREKPLER
jgi:hypothetical protein